VTKPSSVARQGTIAGTQVRLETITGPILIGRKSKDWLASAADGHRVSGIVWRMGFKNFHIY
jgi:hypothetical protein